MKIEDAEIAIAAIDAATCPERWDALCDVVATRLGARAFMLQEYNVLQHSTPTFYASQTMRTGEGRQILEEVVAGHSNTIEERNGYASLANTTPGTVLGEAEAFGFDPSGPPPVNPTRDRVFAVTGGTSRSAFQVNQIGPWMDVAITCDKQNDYNASKQLKSYAPALSAILQKTLEAKRIINRLTQSYSILLDLFDRLNFGVAFCDATGGVVVANEKLREWLGEKDVIVTVQNKIEAVKEIHKPTLRAVFGKSVSLGLKPSEATLSLAGRSGQTSLVIHVTPVNDYEIRRGRILMFIALDPTEQKHLTADGLAQIGSLTQAETEICDLLLRGLSTASVSEFRGTALETVRGQIKSIMQKLDCERRFDLVRLAMVTSPKLFLNSGD